MDWLFPDFRDTDLIYHGTRLEHLSAIFRDGLRPGVAKDGHGSIYDALWRHRPSSIPDWVDPRRCTFGYVNRRRFTANHHGAATGPSPRVPRRPAGHSIPRLSCTACLIQAGPPAPAGAGGPAKRVPPARSGSTPGTSGYREEKRSRDPGRA